MLLRKLVVSMGAALGLAVASTSPAAAITGGSPATTGTAPYQVSVITQGQFGRSHACGGFLLDANKVVTAAHCVDGQDAGSLQVEYGGVNRNHLPHTRWVKAVHGYPGFNAETLAGDIAVLTLRLPVTESATVQFAPLATTDPAAGAVAKVTGWGRTQADATSLPTLLHTVQLPITTPAACEAAYSGVNLTLGGDEGGPLEGLAPALHTTSMLCAGPAAGGKGICFGDSGGPAVVNGVVVGIASWARGCGEAGSPSVFTSAAHYRNWIHSA
ncbi:serine protease [Streptomyces sp. NBC_00847]|uniref:S1 family serine peptidase n=1 Tax=Streptomyces sp. NBC_00847 TaxID=2975850 RepID=UPI002250EED8|nr:serine protease [Streptomyces sp. NBC_00847]MCX4883198.1 serine protease [Streptomyces sp. NBC_00847]